MYLRFERSSGLGVVNPYVAALRAKILRFEVVLAIEEATKQYLSACQQKVLLQMKGAELGLHKGFVDDDDRSSDLVIHVDMTTRYKG